MYWVIMMCHALNIYLITAPLRGIITALGQTMPQYVCAPAPYVFCWKSEGCVRICLSRSQECVTNAVVCACVCDRSSPTDSCLTAVAEGLREAVKTQPNKPCVSSTAARHYAPRRHSAVGLTVYVEGNVHHLNKCLQLSHRICHV